MTKAKIVLAGDEYYAIPPNVECPDRGLRSEYVPGFGRRPVWTGQRRVPVGDRSDDRSTRIVELPYWGTRSHTIESNDGLSTRLAGFDETLVYRRAYRWPGGPGVGDIYVWAEPEPDRPTGCVRRIARRKTDDRNYEIIRPYDEWPDYLAVVSTEVCRSAIPAGGTRAEAEETLLNLAIERGWEI